MLNDWEKIARELGDYDLVQVFNVFEMYTEMVRKEDSDCLGNWVPSRTAAKEIFRLRKQVEVLERVRDAAENLDPADGSDELSEAIDAAGKDIAK